MAKPFTHVDVFAHIDGKEGQFLALSGEAMNKIRLASLKKAGTNWDDTDVVFNIHDYPVWEMNPPDYMDREKWIAMNVLGMEMLRKQIFSKGAEMYEDMSEDRLCRLIKAKEKCNNEEAFEIASKIRESNHIPATHILWTCTLRNCPEYMKVHMIGHNKSVKNLIEEKGEELDDTLMICLDECDRNHKPEDYIHKGKSEVLRLSEGGKMVMF